MTYARGLDVSRFNNINWDQVPAYYRFVYIQTSYGSSGVDSSWRSHYEGAKRTGRYVGPYHFCHEGNGDPETQADFFARTAKVVPWDLPPALDFEKGDVKPAEYTDFALRCANKSGYNWGLPNLLYSYPYYYKQNFYPQLNDTTKPQFLNHSPWPADYSKQSASDASVWTWPSDGEKPFVPQPWVSWLFWQIAGNRTGVPGFSTMADIDVFNGSDTDLDNFVANMGLGWLPPSLFGTSIMKPRSTGGKIALGLGVGAAIAAGGHYAGFWDLGKVWKSIVGRI